MIISICLIMRYMDSKGSGETAWCACWPETLLFTCCISNFNRLISISCNSNFSSPSGGPFTQNLLLYWQEHALYIEFCHAKQWLNVFESLHCSHTCYNLGIFRQRTVALDPLSGWRWCTFHWWHMGHVMTKRPFRHTQPVNVQIHLPYSLHFMLYW